MTPDLDMVKAFAAKHAMVSFEEPRQIEVAVEVCQSVVLDNGAFTAWTQGKPHDFNGYADWCRKWIWHPAVEWCVIPDVIDGDEAANDKLLWQWTLPREMSVPVYHLHESLSRLSTLASRYPRVALGSSGQYADPGTMRWWERIAEIMPVVCNSDGFPHVKLHGLRMLDPGIFSKLPLASADSCNVARNVGIDSRWTTAYAPQSRAMRAAIMMERIESHASASHWDPESVGVYQNMRLFG
jgi:hypothetical protein